VETSQPQHRDLRTVVHTTLRAVAELETLVRSMNELATQQDELRARHERLERDYRELLQAHEDLRREHGTVTQALTESRAACDTLRSESELRRRASRRRKVMVVDDANSELKMMESILSSVGHQVLAYGDGAELEEKVAAERPDVVLLDIIMPNRNGYEILRSLKRDERTKHTPVVIITSRNQDSDRVWSKRQGADEYVVKPFTREQLLAVVERVAG